MTIIGSRPDGYILLVILLLVVSVSAPAVAEQEKDLRSITWLGYNEGMAQGRDFDKPVFLHFTAPWCKWCRKMKKETYTDPRVIRFMTENYTAVMIVITLTDFDLKIIPDSLTLPGIPIGLLYHGWFQGEWADSFLGILAGGGSLFLIAELYLRLRKREGMGGGDVKLAAMMGAFLGWQGVFLVLFLSSLAGGLFGVCWMVFGNKGAAAEIPFGVFLAPIGLIALLYSEPMIAWYLQAVIIPR